MIPGRTERVVVLAILTVFTALSLILVVDKETAEAQRDDYRRSLEQATSQPVPTITQRVKVTSPPKTLPPKTVEVTVRVTERASRSNQRVNTPERTAGQRLTAATPLTGWKADYWRKGQEWATWPKTRAVIDCESSNRPTAVAVNNGVTYRGLYQFNAQTWASYGGLEVAPNASQATRAEQNYVAYRLFIGRGWAPWSCA
jgi:hypothetical protein